MNTTRAFLFATLAIPLTLGFAAVADDLSFHPAKGQKVQKELRMEGEFRVTEISMTMNGEPMPGEMLDQLTAQEILMSVGVDVTETFLATKDGAPTDLLRSYDKLTTTMEIGDEMEEPDSASALEGKVVRFQWDEEDGEFKKSFHESTGDDDLLEGLIDDMEVRALLPAKKVSSGDTWEVQAENMMALFFPGGVASGAGDAGGGGPDLDAMGEAMTEQFAEAFKEFKIACSYKGAREADGVQVGEIAFTYDGNASLDLGPILEEARGMLGGEAPEMDIEASATLTVKGEGILLWDLATGLLHSYEMQADMDLDLSIQMQLEQQGQSIELTMNGALAGDMTWDLTRL